MTHRSRPEAGNPDQVGDRQAGPDAHPVCLRGCRPDQEPPSGLQLLVKARAKATRLVGIAKTALPTLLQAHYDAGDSRCIAWDSPLPGGAPTQEKWAFGWLTAWVRKGRSARRLAEVYASAVRDFEKRYQEAKYGRGECMPWALRGHLQGRAKDLPSYGPEHFRERPAVFQPTAWQNELREWRKENRSRIEEARREEREERRRAKLSEVDHANMPGKAGQGAASEADAVPEWLQRLEDDAADFAAECAGADMDRRNARREPLTERDAWARDLGWA